MARYKFIATRSFCHYELAICKCIDSLGITLIKRDRPQEYGGNGTRNTTQQRYNNFDKFGAPYRPFPLMRQSLGTIATRIIILDN